MKIGIVSLLLPLGSALLAACSSTPAPMDVTLQASEFRYSPSTIEVQAGQQLTVRMENMGTVEHDFVIQEMPMETRVGEAEATDPMAGHNMGQEELDAAVHMQAMAGLSDTLTFTPTQAGTYEFYCAVAGHKDAGMRGMLVVTER